MVAGQYNNFYLINTVDMKEIIKMSISCNDQSDISRANTLLQQQFCFKTLICCSLIKNDCYKKRKESDNFWRKREHSRERGKTIRRSSYIHIISYVKNHGKNEALKQVSCRDSNMQMCYSLTHPKFKLQAKMNKQRKFLETLSMLEIQWSLVIQTLEV